MGYMIWIIKLLHSQGQNSVYRVRSCQARVWLKTGRGGSGGGGGARQGAKISKIGAQI